MVRPIWLSFLRKENMAARRDRYSNVAIFLHWLLAALVLAQILLVMAGDAAPNRESAAIWRDLHKSVGMSILGLTVLRIIWRMVHPVPPPLPGTPVWQKHLATVVHVLLYAILLILPLTGWLASSAAGRDIVWFGLFDLPLLPVEGGREAAGQFMDMHRIVVKGLYVLVALHVLAALKHHFVDRDSVLSRMVPGLRRV